MLEPGSLWVSILKSKRLNSKWEKKRDVPEGLSWCDCLQAHAIPISCLGKYGISPPYLNGINSNHAILWEFETELFILFYGAIGSTTSAAEYRHYDWQRICEITDNNFMMSPPGLCSTRPFRSHVPISNGEHTVYGCRRTCIEQGRIAGLRRRPIRAVE